MAHSLFIRTEGDMADIRIEMDRGMGWEVRQEGAADVTADALADMLPAYAIQYPHRAFIDGSMVAEAQRPHGRRGKVRVVRHDA
jgi:hypothetical protein